MYNKRLFIPPFLYTIHTYMYIHYVYLNSDYFYLKTCTFTPILNIISTKNIQNVYTDERKMWINPVFFRNKFINFCFFFQGRCNREKPPCKYFHPPQHLKDQLLINGRNHLALKNALMQQMGIAPGQPVLPGQVQPVVSRFLLFLHFCVYIILIFCTFV